MPLSPLARTPSPSPIATSPTRSPSPLTLGHVAGSSNMTQTYQPSTHGASHSGSCLRFPFSYGLLIDISVIVWYFCHFLIWLTLQMYRLIPAASEVTTTIICIIPTIIRWVAAAVLRPQRSRRMASRDSSPPDLRVTQGDLRQVIELS